MPRRSAGRSSAALPPVIDRPIGMVCTPARRQARTPSSTPTTWSREPATSRHLTATASSCGATRTPTLRTTGSFQSPGPGAVCERRTSGVVVNLTNNLPEPSSIVLPGSGQRGDGERRQPRAAHDRGRERRRHGVLHVRRLRPGDVPVREWFGRRQAARDGPVRRPGGAPGHRRVLRLRLATRSSIPTASSCCCSATSTRTCTTPSRPARRYDINALHNRYFAINGREFPDTIQDNGSNLLPYQPYGALVRIQPNTAQQHRAGPGPDDQRRAR